MFFMEVVLAIYIGAVAKIWACHRIYILFLGKQEGVRPQLCLYIEQRNNPYNVDQATKQRRYAKLHKNL
jgi:hypothetical protein